MCTQVLHLRRIGSIHSHLARRPRCSVCQRESSMGAYFDNPKDLGNSTVRRDVLVRQRMAPTAREPWHCSVRTSLSHKTVGRRDGKAGRVVRLAPAVDTPTDAAMFSFMGNLICGFAAAYSLAVRDRRA